MKKSNYYLVAIFLSAFLLYGNTLGHGYVLDDKAVITYNQFVQEGFSGIPKLLTSSYWEGAQMQVNESGGYRPLSTVMFAIEHGIFGANPSVGHFFNVLLFGLTGVILFLFLQHLPYSLLRDNPIIPLLITLLFMAHPVHVEVVANIKSRDSILALFFSFLALWYVLRLIKEETPKLSMSIKAGACLFLALVSKEIAITFYPILLLAAVFFGPHNWINVMKRLGAVHIAPALFLLIYASVSTLQGPQQLHIFDNMFVAEMPAGEIFATKILVLGKYITMLFLPLTFVYDYSYETISFTSFPDPLVWISLIAYVSGMGYLLKAIYEKVILKKSNEFQSLMAFAIACYLFPLMLISNLFFHIGSTMAERFLYEPSLAFCIAIPILIAQLSKVHVQKSGKLNRAIPLYVICGVAILFFTFQTVDRNKAWESDLILFETDIEQLSQNAKANHNLAAQYIQLAESNPSQKQSYYQQAEKLLRQAISIYPTIEFYDDLGNALGNLGNFPGAIEAYGKSISMGPNRPGPYLQVGLAYAMSNQVGQALPYVEKAAQLDGNNINTLTTLGKIYSSVGRTNEAISALEKALQLSPGNKDVISVLATTYEMTGNSARANELRKRL